MRVAASARSSSRRSARASRASSFQASRVSARVKTACGAAKASSFRRPTKAARAVSSSATSQEDLSLCGRPALLAPQLLMSTDLKLHPAKVQRLSVEEREHARHVSAVRADANEPARGFGVLRAVAATSAVGSPGALTDGNPETAWAENRGGAGRGEFVLMNVPPELPISGLDLLIRPPTLEAGKWRCAARILAGVEQRAHARHDAGGRLEVPGRALQREARSAAARRLLGASDRESVRREPARARYVRGAQRAHRVRFVVGARARRGAGWWWRARTSGRSRVACARTARVRRGGAGVRRLGRRRSPRRARSAGPGAVRDQLTRIFVGIFRGIASAEHPRSRSHSSLRQGRGALFGRQAARKRTARSSSIF